MRLGDGASHSLKPSNLEPVGDEAAHAASAPAAAVAPPAPPTRLIAPSFCLPSSTCVSLPAANLVSMLREPLQTAATDYVGGALSAQVDALEASMSLAEAGGARLHPSFAAHLSKLTARVTVLEARPRVEAPDESMEGPADPEGGEAPPEAQEAASRTAVTRIGLDLVLVSQRLLEFPNALLTLVLSLLNAPDLTRGARVCTRLRALVPAAASLRTSKFRGRWQKTCRKFQDDSLVGAS